MQIFCKLDKTKNVYNYAIERLPLHEHSSHFALIVFDPYVVVMSCLPSEWLHPLHSSFHVSALCGIRNTSTSLFTYFNNVIVIL